MTPVTDAAAHTALMGLRQLLVRADRVSPKPEIGALLVDVDAALARFDRGTFGRCDVCQGQIEPDRLEEDPLALSCREHPSAMEAARIERDLSLARRVQRGLLPQPVGAVQGWDYHYRYEPAGDVGGDFCDVLPNQTTGETLVVIGDVSGKGVAASMLMSSVLATIRSLSSVGLPPAELLSRVNALFHDTTSPSSYATLAAALLRPDGHADLYSAGHWPPILRRSRALDAITIESGLPIGLFPDARYAPTPVQLHAGDTLLFYTDGAIDEEHSSGEDVSRLQLGDALTRANGHALDALLDGCLADLARFRNGRVATDDLMLLAIRKAPCVSST